MRKGQTIAVMNDADGGMEFPLENQLRIAGKMDGVFVMGLFDCCREEPTESKQESKD